MQSEAPAVKTTQPYPPGTKWTFDVKGHDHTFTEELVLYAEPAGCWITDDYTRDEIDARTLWQMWVDQQVNAFHEKWPDLYRPGEVPISWYVTQPTFVGIFEGAPHTLDLRKLPGEPYSDFPQEDFLTHYRHPAHAETGEKLNWLRLPVADRGWNPTAGHKGGFIQEVTGWKPSALQPTMDVVHIGAAAGLYVPDIH